MRFEVHFECGVIITPEAADQTSDEIDAAFEDHLERVMNSLVSLNAIDPSVGGSITNRVVEIDVAVEAANADEAQEIGSGIIRSAVHAARGHTPSWSTDWCKVETQRELVDA